MTAQAARMNLTPEQHAAIYDSRAGSIARATVAWTVALAASLSWLLNRRRDPRAGVHLVFGTHIVAFFLIAPDLLVAGCLEPYLYRLSQASSGNSRWILAWVRIIAPLAPLALWWLVAARRVFETSVVSALWRAFLGATAFYAIGLLAHQLLVFKITLASLE